MLHYHIVGHCYFLPIHYTIIILFIILSSPISTRGLDPISYSGVLLSALLHTIV
jgi:hypothetical protein